MALHCWYVFELHHMHCIRCGLLLQTESRGLHVCVCVCVCLCVCMLAVWVLLKWLNRWRCRLVGRSVGWLMWTEGTMYYMGQGRTNPFAIARGDKLAMWLYIIIFWLCSLTYLCQFSFILYILHHYPCIVWAGVMCKFVCFSSRSW